MSAEIRPGQTVLVAALPLPAFGVSMLHEVVERLYGTGESMLDFSDGRSIKVIAPDEGFGPRVREPLPAFDTSTDGLVREMLIADDELTITYEEAQEICVRIGMAMAEWFDAAGGINYITARFAASGDEEFGHWITVQKADRPTAHDLRGVAERRVKALERQLRANGIEPDASEATPTPDN